MAENSPQQNKEENGRPPVIAIVGRPNVGKSTLFNRISGKRKAIESDIPGTTRDRIYSKSEWCGKNFTLIDTAGLLDKNSQETISKLTKTSIEVAISEADILIFLVDINEITLDDKEIAKILRKSNRKIFLVANKSDNQNREIVSRDVLSLGFGYPELVAAISGRGVGDFLEKLTKDFPSGEITEIASDTIDVALIGRPNVGKSTLLNLLVEEEKSIVSNIPGTTRDSVDAILNYGGKKIKFIDTAGIRRRGKIEKGVEKFSVLRTISSIESAAIVVVLLDAEEGLTNQDAHVIGDAKDQGKSIIVAVNKFDIWDNETEEDVQNKMSQILGKMQAELAFVPFVPIIFLSAKTGKNQNILLKKIVEVYSQRFIEIETEELKEIITGAKERNPQLPPISDFYQERTNPIVFKLVCRNRVRFHFSHLRYLENVIRDSFPYTGTPIFIDFADKR